MQHPNEIELCPNHGKVETPLVYTMKFDNYEYWCPKCGYKCGIFDNKGVSVPEPSVALLDLQEQLKADTEEFLLGDQKVWTYENGETENQQ